MHCEVMLISHKMLRMRKFKKQPVQNKGLEVELVPSSKQKRRLRAQQVTDAEAKNASRGVSERNGLPPQVMGGGDEASGGDGTGWAGGITIDYWVRMLENLSLLEGMLGRPPVEGQDYPSEAQMEQAKRFYQRRETR